MSRFRSKHLNIFHFFIVKLQSDIDQCFDRWHRQSLPLRSVLWSVSLIRMGNVRQFHQVCIKFSALKRENDEDASFQFRYADIPRNGAACFPPEEVERRIQLMREQQL